MGPTDDWARPTSEMGQKPGGHTICLRTERRVQKMGSLPSLHWRSAMIVAVKLIT